MTTTEEQRAEVTALVRELLARLDREDLTELTVTKGDLKVRVRKGEARASGSADDPTPERSAVDLAPREAPATPSDVVEVKAPLTGVFYRAPSPQATPYVQVGSAVTVGQVIGLIEAMKLFNEIHSTVAGRVRRIVAETGQLVRAHAPVIEVEPLS